MNTYRTAVMLLRELGPNAVPVAEAQAHALIDAAKVGDAARWVRIVEQLRELMRGPDADTTLH